MDGTAAHTVVPQPGHIRVEAGEGVADFCWSRDDRDVRVECRVDANADPRLPPLLAMLARRLADALHLPPDAATAAATGAEQEGGRRGRTIVLELTPTATPPRWLDATPCETAYTTDAVERTLLAVTRAAAEDARLTAYTVAVEGADTVRVSAESPVGLAHATATLAQLTHSSAAPPPNFRLPGGARIRDAARFPWRGLLLDCARHFMPVATVVRAVELLAYHKLNVLHWHLVDDQAWRLHLARFPRLTGVGAWRAPVASRPDEPVATPGGLYGGCYTPEEVRRVVLYAAERFVLVVPEIELPGHWYLHLLLFLLLLLLLLLFLLLYPPLLLLYLPPHRHRHYRLTTVAHSMSVLAAYPELGCTGRPVTVPTDWGIFEDVYCAGREEVEVFLRDLLHDTLLLFPGPFVHIGGDEVPKTRWAACAHCRARMRQHALATPDELQVRHFPSFLFRSPATHAGVVRVADRAPPRGDARALRHRVGRGARGRRGGRPPRLRHHPVVARRGGRGGGGARPPPHRRLTHLPLLL